MSWLVSASRASARIFDRQGDHLTLLTSIACEKGRLRDRDIDSDKPGRSFARATAARHALGTEEDAHERAANDFARLLAERLRHAHDANEFSHLILVAEPHFLGLLRAALDPQVARTVVQTVTKDLEMFPQEELAARLPSPPVQVI